MSAVYAVISDKCSDSRRLSSAARILHDGLMRYGRGGASEPCEGEVVLAVTNESGQPVSEPCENEEVPAMENESSQPVSEPVGSEKAFENGGLYIVMGSIQSNAHVGVPNTPCVVETDAHIAVCDVMIYNRGSFPGQEELSDGELLVKVFEREGLPGLRSLSGDYAALLLEKESGNICLLRDHMGIRPLYVLKSEKYTAVSTDYRPFFTMPECGIDINEKQLYEHLVLGVTASLTETLFSNISKAQAGCVTHLPVSGEEAVYDRYWTPGMRKVPKDKSDGQYEKVYAKLVRDAVKNRAEAVGGVAIGSEFSGGLDSGIVVSVLDEYAEETDSPLPILTTWSPSEEEYPTRDHKDEVIRDERKIISRFCEEKGNTCIYRPRQNSADKDKYLRNVEREDICEYDSDIITYTTEALEGRGIRTIFSGWGGDEAITMRFGPAALIQAGEHRALLHEAVHASGGRPKKFLGYYKRALESAWDILSPWDGVAANGWDFSIADEEYARRIEKTRGKKQFYFGWDPVSNLMTGGMESRTLIAASAAADAGMVYMFPLLDPLVIDYALNVPRRLYLKDGIRRYLPQKALADILPDYLTKFSGEPNVEKLDTGRMDLYYEVAEKTQAETDEIVLSRIDREMFAEYVDFDELERGLLKSEDAVERNTIRKIARTLYKIQILLEKTR